MGDVGGNTLGLYGGIFGPTGGTILSHGYQGAFHIWEKQVSEDEVERWQPMVGPSGHYGPVQVRPHLITMPYSEYCNRTCAGRGEGGTSCLSVVIRRADYMLLGYVTKMWLVPELS